MVDLVYAIRVSDMSYSGLTIMDVKIGKTTNINSTLSQYRRGNRSIELLDLWKSNEALTLSQCERGIQKIAERYAYSRKSEKFIFLQESYREFSDNVSQVLEKTTKKKLESRKEQGKVKDTKDDKGNYIGKKPKLIVFGEEHFEVSTWRSVLKKVVQQIKKEKGNLKGIKKICGRKRYYFVQKVDKGTLRNPVKIPGTKYFFEGNISANRTMAIIHGLLDRFGYKDSDFEVYTD